jgi:hypothetical protein
METTGIPYYIVWRILKEHNNGIELSKAAVINVQQHMNQELHQMGNDLDQDLKEQNRLRRLVGLRPKRRILEEDVIKSFQSKDINPATDLIIGKRAKSVDPTFLSNADMEVA